LENKGEKKVFPVKLYTGGVKSAGTSIGATPVAETGL